MSRRPKGFDDPRVVQFRPRPKPSRLPPRWRDSLNLFGILLIAAGLLRGLYTGFDFAWTDILFVVLLAGSIALGDLLSGRQ